MRFDKPSIFVGPSFWNMMKTAGAGTLKGKAVRTTMRRIKKYTDCESAFQLRAIFVAMNMDSSHWIHAKLDFERMLVSFRNPYHTDEEERLKKPFEVILGALAAGDRASFDAKVGSWQAKVSLAAALAAAAAAAVGSCSGASSTGNCGVGDEAVPSVREAASFSSGGRAAVLMPPTTEGSHAALHIYGEGEAGLQAELSSYSVGVEAVGQRAAAAVRSFNLSRGATVGKWAGDAQAKINFKITLESCAGGGELQRRAGFTILPVSGVVVVDHFGLKSGFKGHGHGRALWMAMMLIADHITKTVFKSKLKKSKVITPTGDGPAFYRHMGYTLHKGDGNNDLTLEIATHTAIGGGAGERPTLPAYAAKWGLGGWSFEGKPPQNFPRQDDSVSCGPMTLAMVTYESDGLEPGFNQGDCEEGGVFRPRITHDLDRGRIDSVWELQQGGACGGN